MIAYHIALFLSFLASLFMASFVYYLNRKEPLNRQFAIFALTMAYGAFVEFEAFKSIDIHSAHVWHFINIYFGITVVTFIHFLLIFTKKISLLKNRLAMILLYAMGLIISLMILYRDTDIYIKRPWGFVSVFKDPTMITLGTIVNVWGSLMGIVIVAISFAYYVRVADARKKKQAKYTIIGFCAVIISGITTEVIFPYLFSISMPSLTTSSFTITAIFISYSIWKFRLFSIDPETVAENIFATMPESLILVNSERTIIKVNRAMAKLSLYNENELLGKPYSSIFLDPSDVDGTIPWETTLFKNAIIHDTETNIFTSAKTLIPVSLSGSVISESKDRFSGIVLVLRDLRERKEADNAIKTTMVLLEKKSKGLKTANRELVETTDQLIQAEKLTMLGELTASVVHELNQPLNVTKVICQSIIRDIRNNRYDPKSVEEELPEIVRQIDKMDEIIEHMRVFSSSGSGEFHQAVDVNTLIEDTFKFVSQQMKIHDIDVRTELSPALEQIKGDPIRLEQMLLNLITNARHALEPSGKDKKTITVRTSNDRDQGVSIEITDNGSGIPNDIRDKIFTAFFTTKDSSRGTGLGLSVVKRIVDEHNGKIEVESAPGEYTTFRIFIPANAG